MGMARKGAMDARYKNTQRAKRRSSTREQWVVVCQLTSGLEGLGRSVQPRGVPNGRTSDPGSSVSAVGELLSKVWVLCDDCRGM